ncbi:uncharacterized protein RSE6_14268 [Rhynchosporium secalis]|uniref:Uncharacterized protein n=1 Tax=Rhynchosporium secalis TaxID=38038 RepID=A0A1E1MUX5_RHYSE|nr:uncharacterized protein RSE6_14268 [Rhynchosporium secalis]
MASKSSISLNLKQNSQDFALDFNTQPNIFRLGYFSKVLDPPKEDPSVTVHTITASGS